MATWSMTVLNVWDEVQLIAQDSTARWGETQRTALVNSVVAQVAKDTRSLMQSAEQNIVGGQANYALPTACPGMAYVRRVYLSGEYVYPMDAGNLDRYERDGVEYDDGRPKWYARDGDINITPVPQSDATNALRIHYAGLPDAVSEDADPIPLPLDLQLAVVLGCARRVLLADGRGQDARDQDVLYREEIAKYLRKGGEWQEPRQAHIIDEDVGIPRNLEVTTWSE